MSSLRFRSGQIHLRKFRVDSATVIEPGHIVCLSGGQLVPASSLADAAEVASSFVGVAHQRSGIGETAPVSVDVSPLAVYESNVQLAAYEVGDLLAVSVDGSPSTTELVAADAPDAAIAMAAEFADAGRSRLRVTFASTVCTASNHAVAQMG